MNVPEQIGSATVLGGEIVGNEGVAYVDKGPGYTSGRYVSVRFNEQSLRSREWFLGHYFNTPEAAERDYGDRLHVLRVQHGLEASPRPPAIQL